MRLQIHQRLEPRAELWQWQIRARCRGLGWLFFGAEYEGRSERNQREHRAKQLCAQCPVITQCRDHAVKLGEPFGIWGGLSVREREVVAESYLLAGKRSG